MKKIYSIFIFLIFALPSLASTDSDNKILLNAFHKYGITKCDSFILKNSKLKTNWHFFISKHAGGIDGPVTEVSLIQIYGKKSDTVKIDQSYIQSPQHCFVHERITLTYPGSCKSNIDGDYWYVTSPMPKKDYVKYENKGGVEMYAKEITVGNFKACVQEISIRNRGKQD